MVIPSLATASRRVRRQYKRRHSGTQCQEPPEHMVAAVGHDEICGGIQKWIFEISLKYIRDRDTCDSALYSKSRQRSNQLKGDGVDVDELISTARKHRWCGLMMRTELLDRLSQFAAAADPSKIQCQHMPNLQCEISARTDDGLFGAHIYPSLTLTPRSIRLDSLLISRACVVKTSKKRSGRVCLETDSSRSST
jgi:hypothetical protein